MKINLTIRTLLLVSKHLHIRFKAATLKIHTSSFCILTFSYKPSSLSNLINNNPMELPNERSRDLVVNEQFQHGNAFFSKMFI